MYVRSPVGADVASERIQLRRCRCGAGVLKEEPALRVAVLTHNEVKVDTEHGRENRRKVLAATGCNQVRYGEYPSNTRFSFALARNQSLAMIPEDAYALIVDADDVYFRLMQQSALRRGYPTDEFRQQQNDAWARCTEARAAAEARAKP